MMYYNKNQRSEITSVTIPATVTFLDPLVFCQCYKLETINFEGTMEQWNAIIKDPDWNRDIPATYVQCSDGRVYF